MADLMEFFARRKTNRKKGAIKGRTLHLWFATAALLASFSTLYVGRDSIARAAGRLRGSLIDQPYFSLREIQVKAGNRVGGSEIVAMAGLSQGMNIWKVDPETIEKKVRQHPWVKQVLVRRELPSRVVIEVTERAAKGIALLGKPYYVDGDGVLFKVVDQGEKMDFPLLTGLRRRDFASHAPATRQKVREALRLSDLLGSRSLALSEIHFDPHGEVIVFPMAYPVALHMGWGDWEEKVQRLNRILGMWRGKEGHLAVLDFSFDDQVVARIKKTKG
jgi:cell division protein FtsQ